MESNFLKRFRVKINKYNGNLNFPLSEPINKDIRESQIYGTVQSADVNNLHATLSKNRNKSTEISPLLPSIKSTEKFSIMNSSSQKHASLGEVKNIKKTYRNNSVLLQSPYYKKPKKKNLISQSLDLKDSKKENTSDISVNDTSLSDKSISPIPHNHNNSARISYASRNSTADSVVRYKPYTINDYVKIKPKKYMMLGGLGPNIGTEDWKKAIEIKERMQKYYKLIQDSYRSV